MLLPLLSLVNDALYDALPYSIVCLGLVWTTKYIRFPDLTCSGTFVLGGAAAAIATVHGAWPWPLVLLLVLLAGALGGLLTALLHIGMGISPVLAGILSAFVLYSINLMLLAPTLPYGEAATVLRRLALLDREVLPGLSLAWHPYVIALFAGVALLVKLGMDWFFHSEIGLALRALEDDAGESALTRQGWLPGHYRTLALAIGNAVVALAGALVSFKEGAANAHRGFDVLVTGLIAFLIGDQLHTLAHAVSRRVDARGSTWTGRLLAIRFTTAAASGAILYFALLTASQRLNVPSVYAKIVVAMLVAAAAADSQFWRRLRTLFSARSAPRPPTPALPALSVENLRFRYPGADRDTLHGLSFTVDRGELVRLRGDNGAGKTTALRAVAGFLEPDAASAVAVNGQYLSTRDRLRQIAYVDQNPQRGVVGRLSTIENLALAAFAGRPSIWRRAVPRGLQCRVAAIAELGELHTLVHVPAANLSGGQRQLVNVLMPLVRTPHPTVVLLDEPANNLDAGNRDKCVAIVQRMHRNGTAVVIVDHAGVFKNVDREICLTAGQGQRARSTEDER